MPRANFEISAAAYAWHTITPKAYEVHKMPLADSDLGEKSGPKTKKKSSTNIKN
jgi:hypothetical protein